MDARKINRDEWNQVKLSPSASPKGQASRGEGANFNKRGFHKAIIGFGCGVFLLGVLGWGDFLKGEVGVSGNGASKNGPAVATKPTSDNPKRDSSFHAPIYKPPKGIGAPGGRIGGGSRGQEALAIFALVPDHLGLTIDDQPTLYWYLSKPAPYPLVLTVNDVTQVKPLLEITLTARPKAGIHSMPLQQFNIRLEAGKEYQWFVSLAVDPENPSQNIIAGGRIQRVLPQEILLQQLRNAEPDEVTAIYSEAGLWYDALASISDLIEASPNQNDYRLGRKRLLEQVDLMEVAKAEENLTLPKDSTYWNDPNARSIFTTTFSKKPE